MRTLASKWSGLSRRLLATVYPVDIGGARVGDVEVQAPVTEGELELTANWQSAFEHAGAETKAPALTAMAQTGALAGGLESVIGKPGGDKDKGLMSRLSAELVNYTRTAQGRSGMTKMNSTQVFSGSPPVKIPLTLHFRAFSDAEAEVQAPIDQLVRWTLAKQLAVNGGIVEAINAAKGGGSVIEALLPSKAPQQVGLTYGGLMFAPMVIESLSYSLTGPRGGAGGLLSASVRLSLTTLTALDADDWARVKSGRPARLFSNT